jgi:hypothetical protein
MLVGWCRDLAPGAGWFVKGSEETTEAADAAKEDHNSGGWHSLCAEDEGKHAVRIYSVDKMQHCSHKFSACFTCYAFFPCIRLAP